MDGLENTKINQLGVRVDCDILFYLGLYLKTTIFIHI